jgi:hypothetical protein
VWGVVYEVRPSRRMESDGRSDAIHKTKEHIYITKAECPFRDVRRGLSVVVVEECWPSGMRRGSGRTSICHINIALCISRFVRYDFGHLLILRST